MPMQFTPFKENSFIINNKFNFEKSRTILPSNISTNIAVNTKASAFQLITILHIPQAIKNSSYPTTTIASKNKNPLYKRHISNR